MANVLHKATLQYRRSVNTTDFLDGSWLINPNQTIINTVPKKYWKVVGEALLEMDAGEKATADGSELPALKIARKALIAQTIKQIIEANFPPEKQRTLFFLLNDARALGLVNRLAYLQQLWTWMKQGVQLNHNKDDAVDSAVDASEIAAVTLNLSAINASIPDVSIRGALAIVD